MIKFQNFKIGNCLKIENWKLKIILAILFILVLPKSAFAGIITSAPSSLGLTSGLVGHWTFDNKDIYSTSALDKSGNGNKGTITGATKIIGKLAQALRFNGSNNFTTVSYSSALAPSLVSVSFWFNSNNINDATQRKLLSKTEAGGYAALVNGSSLDGTCPAYNLCFAVRNINGTYYSAYYPASNLKSNTWYHFTGTYDGVTVRLFVNGSEVGTPNPISGVIEYSTSNPLCIGSEASGAACDGGNYFNGSIDDVRVYNRALSASEIKRLYNVGSGVKMSQTSISTCDGSVWYCDKPTTVANSLGDAPQLVVAKVDISGTKQWKTANTACDTPQCGIDGGQDGDNLVSSNTVDFTAYPARDACKAIGGRLPTVNELLSIYNNKSLFGSFQATGVYWSATEYFTNSTWDVYFLEGSSSSYDKTADFYVRCVKPYTPSSDSLNNGLVGHWTFDNKDIYGTTALDKSGNNNNGAITGATKTIGKLGQSLKFNGTSDYVSKSGQIDNSSTGTIAGWVKIDSVTGDLIMFGQGNETDNQYLRCGINNGKIRIAQRDLVPDSSVESIASIDKNAWHHIVCLSNGSSWLIYLDGLLVNSTVTQGSNIGTWLSFFSANNPSFIIGTGYRWGSHENYFNGSIDDVRIYNRALSASEIKRLYNQGSATKVGTPTNTLTSGLVGHWTFDGNDVYGNTALDKSGLGNNGTITGATTALGKLGQALKFNGSSDYINIPSILPINNVFTVSTWFKTTSNGVLFSEQVNALPDTSGSRDLILYVETNGYLHGGIYTGSIPTMESASPVNDGKWHSATLVVNALAANRRQEFYVDGNFVNFWDATPEGPYNMLYIGTGNGVSWPNTNENWFYFNGSIDDVRIYNRALSADEVKRLYQMGR